MTLLITGTHGLVGQNLVRILQQWPGKVVLTGRGPCRIPSAWMKDFLYVPLDITNRGDIMQLFETYKPNAVIHSAAEAQPDACELDHTMADLVNTTATQWLLEAAAQYRSFFTYMSTDFVFSGAGGPYVEEDDPDPVNYYGLTKLRAEQAVQQYPFGWAIVRTVLVYGNTLSGTRTNIISWVLGELQKGKPIRVVGDQLRTPTYAGDLAAAVLQITMEKRTGIWHISGKDALTPHDIALLVAGRMQLDATLITKVDASVFSQPATRPLKTPFDISKAVRELGYSPVYFMHGLELTINN